MNYNITALFFASMNFPNPMKNGKNIVLLIPGKSVIDPAK